jgi:hypothetical protein
VKVSGAASDTFVVEAKSGDPRAICEKVSEIVGNEGIVAPLLVDDEGHQLIPTGHLQVRFKQPPTDDSLAAFAQQHRLSAANRNKWNPKQVEFALRSNADQYWPDAADEIASDTAVEAAWPDVMASFKRERI